MNIAGVVSASMFDAGCRGVDALRERLPVEPLRARLALGHDDLAVEQARLGQQARERLDELGEVAGERLGAAAADLDVLAVPRDERRGSRPTSARSSGRPATFAGSGTSGTDFASIGAGIS